MKQKVILETKRLKLIDLDISHSKDLFEFWSDEEVTKYMNIETFTSKKQAENMIEFLLKLMNKGSCTRYTIIIKDKEEIIGTCGMNYLDNENNRTEIGYDIGKKYWNKGYATEILEEYIRYIIKRYNLHRVEAKVDPRNIASIKLLTKLGFLEEGLLKGYEKTIDGYIDVLMYSYIK